MPFEWLVAIRFLREGRVQTTLILAGIGVGVGVIIFLSALIEGLQASLIQRTLGTQPQIVLRAPDEEARPQFDREGGVRVLAEVQRPAQRLRSIMAWPQVIDRVRRTPGVVAASPVLAGAGLAIRGTADRSIALRGIEPETFGRIIDLARSLSAGEIDVSATNCVIGVELAKDLGVRVGDKLRVETAGNRAQVFTVRGLLDVGNRDLNLRWVYVSLRNAQTLLDLPGGISSIEIRTAEIFAADTIAERIAADTGMVAESWMTLNTQLLVGLRSQNSSSYMIQFFVIVAVTLGIASVLVVSVVQKSRQIGILRAFGTSRARIRRVFLLEGGILGIAGATAGIAIGTGLALFFQSLATNPDGTPTFPVNLGFAAYARAIAVALVTGLLGAWLPARRAAALDPAVAIRNE